MSGPSPVSCFALSLLVACSRASEAPPPPPAAAPSPVQAPRAAGPSDGGASVVVDAAATDVPPLRANPEASDDPKRAGELNNSGLALHRAKRYAEAIEKFRAALVADPTVLLARYNLACAFERSGDTARGLAVLGEFKALNCGRCRGILAHATTDPDWTAQWKSPPFIALTSDAVHALMTMRAAAVRLAAAWRKCSAKGFEPFVDRAQPITIEQVACCVDAPTQGPTQGPPTRRATRASEIVPERDCGKANVSTTVSDRIDCNGRCCDYQGDIHDGDWLTLLGVCFRNDGAEPLRLDSVSIGSGP